MPLTGWNKKDYTEYRGFQEADNNDLYEERE